jgi:hypothetical protein
VRFTGAAAVSVGLGGADDVVEDGLGEVVVEALDVVDEDAVEVGVPPQAPSVPTAARATTTTAVRRRVVTDGG